MTVYGDLYDRVQPLAYTDQENANALLALCFALSASAGDVDQIVADTDDGPGWSIVLDPVRCPAKYLPWLAQLVGTTIPAQYGEAQARQQILTAPNHRRGTPQAIITAVRATLSDPINGVVLLTERDGAPATYTVTTFNSQTPDPAATAAAVAASKPAGFNTGVQHIDGHTYGQETATNRTYADAATVWTTYANRTAATL